MKRKQDADIHKNQIKGRDHILISFMYVYYFILEMRTALNQTGFQESNPYFLRTHRFQWHSAIGP